MPLLLATAEFVLLRWPLELSPHEILQEIWVQNANRQIVAMRSQPKKCIILQDGKVEGAICVFRLHFSSFFPPNVAKKLKLTN